MNKIGVAAAMATAMTFGVILWAQPGVAARMPAGLSAIDPDHDGLISLEEAQVGGAKKFAAMDPDNDALIDMKEAKGVLKASFKSADPDNDGLIDKAEYTALVDSAFKAADPDNDGQIDLKEMKTPAGKRLLALIR